MSFLVISCEDKPTDFQQNIYMYIYHKNLMYLNITSNKIQITLVEVLKKKKM